MISNQGLIAELDLLLRSATINASIRLFQNNFVPDATSVLGDFTEPSFPGYNPINTRDLTWPGPSLTGVEVVTNGPLINFLCSGAGSGTPCTIYGLFVQIQDSGGTTKLWEFDLFDTPIAINSGGDEVRKKLNFKRMTY